MKVYQRFILDEELIEDNLKASKSDINPVGSAKALRKSLVNMGYEVLTSNEFHCGVPGSIVLGANFGEKDHKRDFYELAEKLELPFHSGNFYTLHQPMRAHQQFTLMEGVLAKKVENNSDYKPKEALKSLEQALFKKGYDIAASTRTSSEGVPARMWVTGDFNKDIGGDFDVAANRAGLPYEPFDYYADVERD